MKYIILGKNVNVTEGLKGHVESKLDKLKRYFNDETEVKVTLKTEKGKHIIEVTVPVQGGKIIRAEESSEDMYASIDMVQETMERQLNKHKNKLVDKHQSSAQTNMFDDDEKEDDFEIVRTKRFGIKPMFTEDACLQMDLLGHDFFVFLNAQTDEVNVVYKRKNGGYGLIEPELG